MSKPENPQAFPGDREISVEGIGPIIIPEEGMSLRDYFTGQAIISLSPDYQMSSKLMAERAGRIADAMLEERSK